MKNYLTFILLFVASFGIAQYDMDEAKDTTDQEPPVDTYEIKKKIYVGADISVSFGTNTFLYLAPMAGYDLWKGISAGVSTMYQLQRVSFTNGSSISSHAFGGGIFTRFRPPPFEMLLLQTEFDVYNAEDFSTSFTGDRTAVPAFMAGIGYAGDLGRGYYQIMLMYDFIHDDNSPLLDLIPGIPLYLRYGAVFYLAE
jgi:hypothetical protein